MPRGLLPEESRSLILDSVPQPPVLPQRPPDIESDETSAFHRAVIERYVPPDDKRFLVFYQCSVRRPFYRA